MAITSVERYANSYENLYTSNQIKKSETSVISEAKADTAKKSSKEEYLKSLQKQVPYVKLQIGYGCNTNNDGKVNVVDVNPKLLEKMQNDPKAEKEYSQRLKDVESCAKFFNNFFNSRGYTVVCRHDYLDENGKYSNFTITVRKDELNEKLRKEAQENVEKQIEKTRENARKKSEQLTEKLEETITEDNKKDEKIEISEGTQDKEMQVIIDAAQNKERTRSKSSFEVGDNFDYKI